MKKFTENPEILLSSVFGPYAQDNEYGSRLCNPMELFHNQVIRGQGPFSLRMFHRSWGLKFIQENIDQPGVLLDFPARKRFIDELKRHPYDIIGISAIYVNFEKAKNKCRVISDLPPIVIPLILQVAQVLPTGEERRYITNYGG